MKTLFLKTEKEKGLSQLFELVIFYLAIFTALVSRITVTLT